MIFCFISCKNEISTDRILVKSILDNKQIAVPRVIPGTNKMDFYILEKLPVNSQTEPGAFGIPEPKTNLKKVNIRFIPKNAVMLMPGTAFSKDGTRIGKGKGFYDVYLEEVYKKSRAFRKSGIKIGYCYDMQIEEKIPSAENDVKVDYVISESGILKCSQ